MPDLATLEVFSLAALALLIVPGPAVMYIVTRSAHQGRRAGLASALGVQIGTLVHVVAAAIGLSALVLSSAVAFTVVKWAGAAYLVYLGLRTLLARSEAFAVVTPEPRPLARIFWQGALVNVLNPKTALFFFAFLPQFVRPERGPVAPQVLVLGALFALLATCTDSTYALLAGTLGDKLRERRAFARRQKYVTGGVYVALGVGTALTERTP
ncbi:LysE family translocator [Deinococcus yavapaiensis]|uniref:Threonine/homoserine/homoserine lactone efflux protein n=1 Tax=Deinococcus yavapaiensis KR-236 TaxID=694435 RepID=A0A318S9X8_9DEIO|nr:LysE family translocator [Deinococcus yavapaiensis]PYE55679.1 threonine/homoserine/homoserine lactone efflux protein [Deinococcus yavapaiensis KR-236]